MKKNAIQATRTVQSASRTVEADLVAVKSRSSHWYGPCKSFCILIVLILPVAVFGVAAFFALPLWAVECAEDDLCEYFDWFLYIMGNLVGLATPLTDVSPTSGHVFAEIIDLLIAVWSLAVAGTCFGVISALAFTNVLVQVTDEGLQRRWIGSAKKTMRNLAAAKGGMGLEEFKKVIHDKRLMISAEQAAQLFDKYDIDKGGNLDVREAERLMSILDEVVGSNNPEVAMVEGSKSPEELQKIAIKVSGLAEAVSTLEASTGAISAKLDSLLSQMAAAHAQTESEK